MTSPLKGFEKTRAKLKALGPKMARKLESKGMRKAAKVMQAAVYRNAPEDTGRLRHFIASRTRFKKGYVRVSVGVLKMSVAKAAKSGITSSPNYAPVTEKGSKYQRGQHWMLRAFRESRQETLSVFLTTIQELVREAVRES